MTADGVGTTPSRNLENFRFFVTGRPERFAHALQSLPRTHDFELGLLILPGVKAIKYGSSTEMVPKYPILIMRFGEARAILEDIWKPMNGFCGAFTETFSAGVLVDSYGEHPDEDRGPDECTYEVAAWVA